MTEALAAKRGCSSCVPRSSPTAKRLPPERGSITAAEGRIRQRQLLLVSTVFMLNISSCNVCTPPPPIEIDGGDWTLVRRVPTGTKWHPTSDRLAGTDTYGVAASGVADWQCNDIGEGWSINFEQAVPGYNELMFASGDGQRWVITTKDAVGGPLVSPPDWYSDEPRTILKSSERWYGPSYQAGWYNRADNPEDPWISAIDHNEAIPRNLIVYGEAGTEANNGVLLNHNGANVFIRRARCRNCPENGLPWIDGAYVNLARACTDGACPTDMSSVYRSDASYWCPRGYVRVGGSVPGAGIVDGRGGSEVVADCSKCAQLCSDFSICVSFECSLTEVPCAIQ